MRPRQLHESYVTDPTQGVFGHVTLVSRFQVPLTAARGPRDDWQGRREPGVLEVRGRPRTQPGAGGTGPTQRDFGHVTLEHLVYPAVRVRGGPVLDVQQCLAQPHRRRAGAAVPYRPLGADFLDGTDRCDDRSCATGEDLADRPV